ncbi:type II toxin-antitoxin system RelE/ParE family toxin [Boseaceae bacterium BT-24-1]|nr:type II toxin-antitoxin system RelE/ParE family toxin [Boseaceae bacterium BT-24-1]
MERENSYDLTRRARDDLFDIFVYGYDRFGEQQADIYASGLEHVFELLAANPRMGREARSIGPGVRRHEHASHVILYEQAPSGILILAIVHSRSVLRLSL